MSISVCIASYNGEKYIQAQIESILSQLGKEDELIISDDSSTDRTVEIIESLQDGRIRLYKNQTFHSHVYNFEYALKQAQGDFIFLADQDDIWMPNKLHVMLPLLQKYDMVLSDAIMTDEKLKEIHPSFFAFHHSRQGLLHNLYKNSYLGCCMGFNRHVLNHALPFPKGIHMHDWWIGLIAEIYAEVYFCKERLVRYRRHQEALTPTDNISLNPLYKKIAFRITMSSALIGRYFKQILLRYSHTGQQR